MKKFFKFLGVVAIIAIIAFAAAMFFTKDLSSTADNFFKAIKANNYAKAEQYLSENFKRATPLSQLKKAFPYDRFKNYKSCSFSTREAGADGTGKLNGSVKFSDGSMLKISISLVKENGQWKIDSIKLPPVGLQTPNKTNPNTEKPAKIDDKTLVHHTMIALVKAIRNKNYSNFYRSTSSQFQESISKARLEKAFDRFNSIQLNWADINSMNPIIKKKNIDKGVLKLVGYYPTNPKHLGFDFEYIKNNGEWKLYGVFLRLE